jgi:aminomethyltransferase
MLQPLPRAAFGATVRLRRMTEAELRHSPLEAVHRRLGAKLGAFGGWLMPIEYAGTIAEHRAVRERAGLFDLSHLGKVDVIGRSALPGIQRLFTNDARRAEVGASQYHHMLNERGGVEEDLFVYHLSDERWFVVPNGANKDKVVAALLDATDDGAVADHDGWGFLAVQGPRSHAVIGRIWPDAVELPFRGCRTVRRGDAEVVLARTGYTGERGYELFADADAIGELWEALLAAGTAVQIEPCGLGARDVLRLEMGYPLYGQDLVADRTPLEAGLAWAVSFDKGEFVGRDALLAQRNGPLPSRLRGLVTDDRRSIPRAHHRVISNDEEIGEVTSGSFSPLLGVGIALAYLSPADAFEPGSEVEIDIRGRRAAARVVQTPFVKRSPR